MTLSLDLLASPYPWAVAFLLLMVVELSTCELPNPVGNLGTFVVAKTERKLKPSCGWSNLGGS